MAKEMYDELAVGLRRVALRNIANRAAQALAETPSPAARKRAADYALGFWLSAALDDPYYSVRFRKDVNEWFAATEQLATATRLGKLLAIAQIELRAADQEHQPAVPPIVPGWTSTLAFKEGDIVSVRRGKKVTRYKVKPEGPKPFPVADTYHATATAEPKRKLRYHKVRKV